MSKTAKNSFSVKQLVDLLDHPKVKASNKKSQPLIDRDQVKKHMRLKWKDPGYCNIQFTRTPCVRAKILNEWELDRIYMATRSYITPKESRPYNFDKESREFPRVTMKAYSNKFQKYLKKVQAENQDLLFKEKRTVTEGIGLNSTTTNQKSRTITFKPTHTASSLFGFTTGMKSFSTKHTNFHIKTVNN